MAITYFHRNQACGFSILKVFRVIEREIAKQEDIEEKFVPSPFSMPWHLVQNSVFTFRNRNKKGVNHISGHIHDSILGLIGCKTILTIHDLVFIDNTHNPVKRLYKWLFWLYIPLKLADIVTCISTETQKKILCHVKTDKLRVIYNPIDPAFVYTPQDFNTQKPTILHVGTSWNKNLERTIKALHGIPCHLRIIGKLSDKVKKLLKEYQIDYSAASNLTDEEIRQEYIKCDIVNFPSIYEGFGMPVIEGQQTGRIVVTSYIEPLIEVSGNAVEYVDPYSLESIRQAYLNIIHNPMRRNRIIKDGLKNVERFDLKNIAEQYRVLYRQLEL